MPWDFLLLVRDVHKSADNWGRLWIRSANGGKWELFLYSYELPWREDPVGRSKKGKSRIKLGTYELKPRSDGAKGWRLQLLGTGHRKYIQIHRAHKSMYIEGCILPVSFNEFTPSGFKEGDAQVQTDSVALMEKLEAAYKSRLARTSANASRKGGNPGWATIQITAQLPPMLSIAQRSSVTV